MATRIRPRGGCAIATATTAASISGATRFLSSGFRWALAALQDQDRRDVLEILEDRYHAHPERFPRGVPVPPPLPTAAGINKPPGIAGARRA